MIEVSNICVSIEDECTTPEGIPGTCIPVHNCTRIWTILSRTPSHKLTTAQRKFLQKSKCKSQKEAIFVCCPECGHIIKNSNADRITDGRPAVLGMRIRGNTFPKKFPFLSKTNFYSRYLAVDCGAQK